MNNKKLLKHAICFLMVMTLAVPMLVFAADDFGTGNLVGINVPQNANTDLPTIVRNVINIILGLLALLAIVIVLIAGFEWMTAGGSEDKVKTAQKRLKYGLVGLVIIFLAYGIVTWVLSTLTKVGTVGGV